MKRYCVGFLFPENMAGHVVLLQKDTKGKPGLEFQHGLLNGMGGKCEDGETGLEAMARECEEEAGLTGLDWEEVCVLTDGLFQLEVFRADMPGTMAVPDHNDVGETFYLIPVADVVKQKVPTIPNLQWLVPMCLGADRAYWPFSIIQSVLEDHTDG